MEDGADRYHLEVTVDAFRLPDLRCEQPRSHGVVEEIGLVELLRVLEHVADDRRIRHADACYQTCSCIDVNRLGHVSSFLPTDGEGVNRSQWPSPPLRIQATFR